MSQSPSADGMRQSFGAAVSRLRRLTPPQRNAFLAAFLGWTLDAFDYFVLVFVLTDVQASFHAGDKSVAYALTLTLAMRPLGALFFGWLADRFGRRPALMADIVFYSVIELLTGFAPNLTAFLVLRALFGIGMGGEWGVGASLALETAPEETRGLLSGILQEGYPVGYLLAAIVYPLVIHYLNWRWMFFIGVAPALIVLFIRLGVQESPGWKRPERQSVPLMTALTRNLGLFVYLIVLMTAFNFMSHGTQDLYPKFLKTNLHFSPSTVSHIAIIYNLGALLGGICFGSLSQIFGRRRMIITAALLALPVVPLWAFSKTAALLALGAFLMQFFVQGAWGVIPAHLSELAPGQLRGLFPGLAYQLGNLCASINAPMQTALAKRFSGRFAPALALVITIVLVVVAVITAFGPERRGAQLTAEPEQPV